MSTQLEAQPGDKPLLKLTVGPLKIDVAKERIEISRADAQVPQVLLLRPLEEHEVIEAVIVTTSETGLISERIIGRARLINLNKAAEFITAPLRKAIAEHRPTTVQDLERDNYTIVHIDEDHWSTLLASITGQDGGVDLSTARLEQLDPAILEQIIGDSLYKPKLLDLLIEHGEEDQPLIAVVDFEDPSTMLWVRWNPVAGGWVTFPFIPQGVPFHDVRKMGELLVDEAKKSPRLIYFLHEFVQELCLEDWINVVEFSSIYQQILSDVEDSATYDAIAYDYHLNVYETEHHHNLSKLAVQIAIPSLTALPSIAERLRNVHLEHTDFAVRKLVERTEIVLTRFTRRRLQVGETKRTQNPKECIEDLKASGISTVVTDELMEAIRIPSRLRNMWTHRGRRLDSKFFQEIGRSGKKSVMARVFGREVELREGERFVVTDEDLRWISIVVTVLVDKLYYELAAAPHPND